MRLIQCLSVQFVCNRSLLTCRVLRQPFDVTVPGLCLCWHSGAMIQGCWTPLFLSDCMPFGAWQTVQSSLKQVPPTPVLCSLCDGLAFLDCYKTSLGFYNGAAHNFKVFLKKTNEGECEVFAKFLISVFALRKVGYLNLISIHIGSYKIQC